jgi:hypothetical protein
MMIILKGVSVRPYIVRGVGLLGSPNRVQSQEVLSEYFSGSLLPCSTNLTTVQVILLHYE